MGHGTNGRRQIEFRPARGARTMNWAIGNETPSGGAALRRRRRIKATRFPAGIGVMRDDDALATLSPKSARTLVWKTAVPRLQHYAVRAVAAGTRRRRRADGSAPLARSRPHAPRPTIEERGAPWTPIVGPRSAHAAILGAMSTGPAEQRRPPDGLRWRAEDIGEVRPPSARVSRAPSEINVNIRSAAEPGLGPRISFSVIHSRKLGQQFGVGTEAASSAVGARRGPKRRGHRRWHRAWRQSPAPGLRRVVYGRARRTWRVPHLIKGGDEGRVYGHQAGGCPDQTAAGSGRGWMLNGQGRERRSAGCAGQPAIRDVLQQDGGVECARRTWPNATRRG